METNVTFENNHLLQQFELHREFTKVFLDGFVLIDDRKRIVKYNQAFCALAKMKAVELRKIESIEHIFHCKIPGTEQSLFDNLLSRNIPARVDEVHAVQLSTNETLQFIVSSFPYMSKEGKVCGACLLLRDVTAESKLMGRYREKAMQSITDPLTGLFTRRFFEEWIDNEIDRCHRANCAPGIGILMFDLDKFKNINDTYGHQAGDYVLQETSKILKAQARKSDILGRYGGEELVCLLTASTASGCCVAAEKFRQAIQNHNFEYGGHKIKVTTSVGVSQFLTSTDTREAVFLRSDSCLYAAKHAGRNVVFSDFGSGPMMFDFDKV